MPLVELDHAAIDRMSAIFLSLPNANAEKVGILTNVLKRINKNNTLAEKFDCGVSDFQFHNININKFHLMAPYRFGQIELLYLAITSGNPTLNLAEWKKIIHDIIEDKESNEIKSSYSGENSSSSSSSSSFSSLSSSSSSEEKLSSLEEITAEDLEEIGEKLSRNLTAEQTRRVMVILNGLRNDATPAEKNTAMVN